MLHHKRRTLFGISAAIAATLFPPAALAGTPAASGPALPAAPAAADDPLLPAAAAWVAGLRDDGQKLLRYPVSRLQRQLRTGYLHSCALAGALEQRGEWRIAYDADGKRHAHIHPKGRA